MIEVYGEDFIYFFGSVFSIAFANYFGSVRSNRAHPEGGRPYFFIRGIRLTMVIPHSRRAWVMIKEK